MQSFTSLPWFICNLFIFLVCAKILAEPAVEQATMVVTNEWLAQEITERLREDYRHLDGEMIVALSRSKPIVELPKGDLSLELTSQPSGGLRSRVLLHYNLTLNNKIVHSDTVPVTVKVLREVFVANRKLARKESIQLDDLKLTTIDVLDYRDTPISPSTDLSGYEMNYTILKGTVLSERYLRLTPSIHRGDIVTGLIKRGLLEINLKLEALEEGAPGQLIRLKNPNTRKTLRGIVRDEESIIIP
jgi:flagella basal body P-ring formation protein FlgA